MKYNLEKILVSLSLLALPLATDAENLILTSPKTSYRVGDSFSVSLVLDTKGKSINTLSGIVVVPKEKLQIVDVRYGSSIISLWVERPTLNTSVGTISFTGGIPGGFSGSAGPILSFGVKAKADGAATISIKDFTVLLNDGNGTKLAGATAGALKFSIAEAQTPKPTEPKAGEVPPKVEEVYAPPLDIIPPEHFVPLVSRHPSVADNKYFASFFAVDKDSGISRYQVYEEPLIVSLITAKFNTKPQDAESPYVLSGQLWTYKVTVRACDQAGNCVERYAMKPLSPAVEAGGVLILVILTVFTTRWLSTRDPRRPRRRMV